MSYLALEKGFPLFKQNEFSILLLKLFSLQRKSRLIFIPEASKIFQFASFIYMIYLRVDRKFSMLG